MRRHISIARMLDVVDDMVVEISRVVCAVSDDGFSFAVVVINNQSDDVVLASSSESLTSKLLCRP